MDRVTKRFYEQFKAEHTAFLAFVQGITDRATANGTPPLMLNRLMFVYFIQKKGFLDGDRDYLRNRLQPSRSTGARGNFHTFYRHFLLRLFHEGSASRQQRTADLDALLGSVPYLNGGLFDVHELEATTTRTIEIPDEAFERIFDFFDQYEWHLDDRPLRARRRDQPRRAGLHLREVHQPEADGGLLHQGGHHRLHQQEHGHPLPLRRGREEVRHRLPARRRRLATAAGRSRPLHLPAVRTGRLTCRIALPPRSPPAWPMCPEREWLEPPADPDYALPTETWREHVARRSAASSCGPSSRPARFTQINDLITYNLDIRQFAQDVIDNCEGPELLRAFYQPSSDDHVLDPTCGSGAFLFAALNILKPLYEACLERMQGFVERRPAALRATAALRTEEASPTSARCWTRRRASTPTGDYFILKSIIINNLYGVDIMEEAVEICKLRLFLKLVGPGRARRGASSRCPTSTSTSAPATRSVGFTHHDAVREAIKATATGQQKILFDDDEATMAAD